MDEHSNPPDSSAETAGGIHKAPRGDTVADLSTDTTAAPIDKPDDVNKNIAPEFELVEITHRGMKWNVPKARGQWDMNVQFEFEEGNRLRGFCILLGGSPAEINRVRNQIYRVARTAGEVDALLDDVAEQANKMCDG